MKMEDPGVRIPGGTAFGAIAESGRPWSQVFENFIEIYIGEGWLRRKMGG
jgi:hypothetical protein